MSEEFDRDGWSPEDQISSGGNLIAAGIFALIVSPLLAAAGGFGFILGVLGFIGGLFLLGFGVSEVVTGRRRRRSRDEH